MKNVPTRLLLVNDDARLRTVLERGGYVVDATASVEEAMRLLREHRYGLALADLVLPGFDGVGPAGLLGWRHPDLPVVLLAERGDLEPALGALRRGASDVVMTPASDHDLLIAVTRTLERRRAEFEKIASRGEEVLLGAVEALAAAIDAKEAHTGQHSRRVARLSLWLAERLGLSPAEKRLLELSAFMHDVGKIGTPDRILNKPGPLDPDERRVIQQHPVLGCEILSQIPDLVFVAGVVRHHHERVDGGGYPDGLRGEAIPLLSRLIGVTDAFEAMTSARAYRPAMPVPCALDEIRAHVGTQFDPALVDLLARRIRGGDALPVPLPDAAGVSAPAAAGVS